MCHKVTVETNFNIFSIACVSCPTLYHRLRDIRPDGVKLHILEYDSRFEKFGDDFVFYDYNKPLELPKEMEHCYDIVVADPPFLSEECLTKTAITVRFMTKNKILLCTGTTAESSTLLLHCSNDNCEIRFFVDLYIHVCVYFRALTF